MKFGATLWLLFLTCLLAGALLYQNRVRTEPHVPGSARILRTPAAAVRTLVLERNGWRAVCERDGEGWRLVEPVQGAADAGAVMRLLYALEDAVRGETVYTLPPAPHEGRLPDFGLAPPAARLSLDDGTVRHRLRVGGPTALGNRVYVLDEARNEVMTVDAALLDALPENLEVLRSTILFPLPRAGIRRLGLRRSSGFALLTLGEDGRWMLRQPVRTRADRAKVNALLDQLLALNSIGFAADNVSDPTPYGLLDAERSVTFADRDEGIGRTFFIGAPAAGVPDAFYGRWEDRSTVLIVPAALAEWVEIPLDALRDSRLTDLDPGRLTALAITSGNDRLEIRREEGVWSIVEPRPAPADQERCAALAEGWLSARATTFGSEAEAASHVSAERPPRARLVFHFGGVDAGEPGVLSVLLPEAPAREGHLLLMREGEDWLAEVPAAGLLPLRMDPLYYRSREMISIEPDAVRRITLEFGERTVSWTRDPVSSRFVSAVSSNGPAADPAAVQPILAAIRRLDAARLLADDAADEDIPGMNPPAVTATFALSGEAGISKALLIGAPLGNGRRQAMVRGRRLLFELEAGQAQPFLAPFADAEALPEQQDRGEEPAR